MVIDQHPAYLFLGKATLLRERITQALLQRWCQQACTTCASCRQVLTQQHHQIQWLKPEKQYYIKSELDIIFEHVAFMRDQQDPFFFILEQADTLSTACSNNLLKVLEEPPTGYHFILLASRKDTFLPTIISRCVVYDQYDEKANTTPLLLQHMHSPLLMMKELEKQKINEHDTRDLLDHVIQYFLDQQIKAFQNQEYKKAQLLHKKIDLLNTAFSTLPMPGSAKIFWRNLLLQLSQEDI